MATLRLERRPTFGWPKTAGGGSARPTNGLVAHYDGSDQGLAAKSHSACRTYWKNTRKFHMGPSRGWSDIGYSFAVCPHGIAMEGRGVNRQQAAQPGGNSTWYSVTFMTGEHERPTAKQLEAWALLRAWLIKNYGVKTAVSGHWKFISTSCPGGVLKKMVADGTLRRGVDSGGKPKPAPKPTKPGTAPGFPGRYLSQPPMMEGKDVRAWQAQMDRRGWSIAVDGKYGPGSESVCRRFQREKGLKVDGVVGPQTWKAAWSAAVT